MQAGVEPLRRVGRGLSASPACGRVRRRRRGRRLRRRNSRPSSPNRSRCRPGGRTPAWRNVRPRSRCRRRSCATAIRARLLPARACSASGTPALRKYFWASTSQATWLQSSGTSMSVWRKTTEPSGFRISLARMAERDAFVRRTAFDRELTPNTHGMPPTNPKLSPQTALRGTILGTVFRPRSFACAAGTPAARVGCVRQIWCREKRLAQSIGPIGRGTQAISGKRNLTHQMLWINALPEKPRVKRVFRIAQKIFSLPMTSQARVGFVDRIVDKSPKRCRRTSGHRAPFAHWREALAPYIPARISKLRRPACPFPR